MKDDVRMSDQSPFEGKVALVPFAQSGAKGTNYQPCDTRYEADEDFRVATLRTRSLVAALYFNGHTEVVACYSHVFGTNHQALLLCQRGQGQQARLDFCELYASWTTDYLKNPHGPPLSQQRLFFPVILGTGNWKNHFGWLALIDPQANDGSWIYRMLRRSMPWIERRQQWLRKVLYDRGLERNPNAEPLGLTEAFKQALETPL